MENILEFQPWSPREIIAHLKNAKKRATDEHPVEFQLIKPELLPWEGMGVLPEKGIFVAIIEQSLGYGKIRRDVVVDFTRVALLLDTPGTLPYACFPVSAVKMSVGGEWFIDCKRVAATGFRAPNLFLECSRS